MNFPRFFKLIFLLSLINFIPNTLFAKHIIGGYTYYEHITADRYKITMLVYRDCNDRTGARFDDVAPVGVFSKQGGGSYVLENVIPVQIESVVPIFVNKDPCINYPSDTCAQLGTYTFEYDFGGRSGDFVFAYQRCCRNEGINNIFYDICGVGSTFFVEISENARNLKNNSPTFLEFPPVLICSNFDFKYDNSAVDIDGDRLEYEFCAPKKGGGLGGFDQSCGFDPDAEGGVRPNPPSRPPYADVTFGAGYSQFQPILGNPPMVINRTTGEITGFPTDNGLYTIGICVREFRNDSIIGKYIRDFQFYITDCNPNLIADVNEDYIDSDGNLIILRCGEKNVFLRNTSQDSRNISTTRWELDINGTLENYSSYDLTKAFSDYGTYNLKLFINEGEICADTGEIVINLFPGIEADFSFEVDSCKISPVIFTNTSTSELGIIEEYNWDFKDGSLGFDPDINHLFLEPGNYNVSLEVVDSNNCRSTKAKVVPYYPTPELVIISPNIAVGCAPQSVFFDNLTESINEDYSVIWDFGDGERDTTISPTHIYLQPGEYTVKVEITSPIGCKIDRTFNRILKINDSPVAQFDFSPKESDRFNPTVDFFNQSLRHINSQWRFGDGSRVNLENPSYMFRDTGFFSVELIVRNDFNCFDTAYATIDIYPRVTHFLPTAFTPNFDGNNDGYTAQGVFEGMRDYAMEIYDRYGQMVFESLIPGVIWDGTNIHTGKEVASGGYMVIVRYSDPRGKAETKKTMITLFK